MRAALLLVAMTLPGTVAASGSLDGGLARVILSNGHEADCIETYSSVCPASMRGSAGTAVVDGEQRFERVALELNGSFVREQTGVALLPDHAITFNASDVYVEHPVFRFWAERFGETRAPAPLDGFGIIITEEEWGFAYLGPGVAEPTDVGRHQFYPSYNEDGGIGYERVGPTNELKPTSTDFQFRALTENPCYRARSTLCYGYVGAARAVYETQTPNVILGFMLEESAVGTDYGATDPRSDALGERAAPSSLPQRSPLVSPSDELERVPLSGPSLPRAGTPQEGWPAPAAATARPPLAPEVITHTRAPPLVEPPAAPVLAALGVGLAVSVILAALYSRITRSTAPKSGPRATILAMLREGPQRVATLAERLAIDRSSVDHHVRVLERNGYVKLARVGRAAVVGLPGQDTAVAARPAAARTQEEILRVLASHAGAVSREILHAAVPHVPLRTRNHAITMLARRGVLRCEWDGHTEMVRLREGAAGGGSPASGQ